MHPRRPRNSLRVPTHEKNSGDAVNRLGTIIQSIFCAPIRSLHSLDRLEMVQWESVPKGSSARAWKLSSRLFSRPDWLPLGLRGWMIWKPSENALIFKRILSTTSTRQCQISLENLYMDQVGALGLIHNTVWTTLLRIINSTHWAH